jgi:guanyl-specific ribonuclease Sa
MADSIIAHNRKLTTGANKIARERRDQHWMNRKIAMTSGKTLLARLSDWAQQEYGVSIGAMALARTLKATEIPNELRTIIQHLEEGTPFPKTTTSG